VVEPNAWDRAREAIARASERDDAVVTPDNAVSPFDASSTMVIPQADVRRHPGPPHPDATQRLGPGRPPGAPPHGTWTNGAPAPRPPGPGEQAPQTPPGGGAHRARVHDAGIDPPPWPAPRSTHLPPEPPTRPVEVSDPRGAPARVAGERPATAPFSAVDMSEQDDPGGDATPPALEDARRPRRPWWRRLLGR
jgi:hypothetical protein